MWLLGLAEGWRVPKKEFAGLDCEGGLLASPDGVGGVAGGGAFLCDGVFQDGDYLILASSRTVSRGRFVPRVTCSGESPMARKLFAVSSLVW